MPQELYKSRNERTTRESLIPLTYILEMIFTKLTFSLKNLLKIFSEKVSSPLAYTLMAFL